MNTRQTIVIKGIKKNSTAGFTLVELMVSIVLGLLITAAATQLFIGGLITTRVQQANAELQDNGLFGLDYIARDIRLANYGNVENPELSDTTSWGGIVLTANTATATNTNLPIPTSAPFISQGLLSHSAGTSPLETVSTTTNEWRGLSNVKIGSTAAPSDQLTIQFTSPNAMTNCEGANVQAGDLVVQRYFMRPDPSSSVTSTNYVLACDANTPTASGATPVSRPTTVLGLGDAGQIIIPRIEYLKFLLGTQDASGNLAYYSINQYRAKANQARAASLTPPKIVLVKMGVLIRSLDNTQNPSLDLSKSYNILGTTVVPNDTSTRYARQAYTVTVALRNALGEKQ